MPLSRKGHTMPREQITPNGTEYLIDGFPVEPNSTDPAKPEDSLSVEQPILHVNWNKSQSEGSETFPGFVQVSMQVDMKQIEAFMDRDNEFIIAHWFYTSVLTRETINKMIRILRHARDAAYGIDE